MTTNPQNTAASRSGVAAAIGVKKRPVEQAASSAPSGSAAGIDLEKLPVEQVLTTLAVQARPRAEQRGGAKAACQVRAQRPRRERGEPRYPKVLGYFMGPIAYMIEAAAIVSAILGHWQDFVIITALLVFNAVLDFWQDRKASNALAALKKGLAPRSDGAARRQMADASRPRPSCPATSSRSGSASSCRPTFALSPATTPRSISRR